MIRQPRRQPRPKHPELPYGVCWRNRPGAPYIAKVWDPTTKTQTYLGTFCIAEEAADAVQEHLRKTQQ